MAGSEVKREAEAIWPKYVDGLPEAAQRIEAAKAACIEAVKTTYDYYIAPDYAPSGLAFAQQAVGTILKDVDALPEAAQRIEGIEAVKVAARSAPYGTTLKRQAREKLRDLQKPEAPRLPTPEAAQRLVQSFSKA